MKYDRRNTYTYFGQSKHSNAYFNNINETPHPLFIAQNF